VVASENMINKSGVQNKGNSLVVSLLGGCFFKNKVWFHHQQKSSHVECTKIHTLQSRAGLIFLVFNCAEFAPLAGCVCTCHCQHSSYVPGIPSVITEMSSPLMVHKDLLQFVGFAYQGQDIVFRFIIEYSSLREFGP
jgi:hypothetical protein